MVYTVYEHTVGSPNNDAKIFSPDTPASITGFTKSPNGFLTAHLKKTVPNARFVQENPAAGNGKQGLATAEFPRVKLYEYDGATVIPIVNAYFLMQMINAKKAENKAYEAAKIKYETERAEYNTKLKAA